VAAARAQLSVELLNRQAAAMDAWHRNSVASPLREIRAPVLIATGRDDIVIPASNALKLVNALPSAWLAQSPHGGHAFIAQYPRALADLINSFLVSGDVKSRACGRSFCFETSRQGRRIIAVPLAYK
jgi:pimeloyl-ACP methyl ester carboxylesterase